MRFIDRIKKHRIGLCTLLLLLLDILLRAPKGFSGWASTWYALDYSIGSGSRLLAGSILHLLAGEYITESAAVKFVKASCILTAILFAWLMDEVYRRTEKEGKAGALLLVALATAGPFSPRYLWDEVNFGRLDLYLLMALTAALILLFYIKKPVLRCLVVLLFSAGALFVHQIYIFIFFPVLLAVLLTDCFSGEKPEKKTLLSAILCVFLVGGCFLYVQLFSSMNAGSAEELEGILSQRTELAISHSALDFEYFHDFFYGFENHTKPFLQDRTVIPLLFITLLLLIPAAAVYREVYRGMRIALREEGERRFLTVVPYLPLLLLCYLPPFVLTVDWDRWVGAMFLSTAMTLLVLNAMGDPYAKEGVTALSADIATRPVPFLGGLLYLVMLTPLQTRMFIPEAYAVLAFFRKLLSF